MAVFQNFKVNDSLISIILNPVEISSSMNPFTYISLTVCRLHCNNENSCCHHDIYYQPNSSIPLEFGPLPIFLFEASFYNPIVRMSFNPCNALLYIISC